MSQTTISFRYLADASSFVRTTQEVEKRLSGLERSAGGFGNVLQGALMGVGFAAVSKGLDVLGNVAGGAKEALFGLNSSAEMVQAQFMAFTKDAGKTAEIMALVRAEADKTPFSFQAMAAATAGLMPAAKQANIPLMELLKTAEILAASNPAQGLEGAAFALREAVSGDFTSIIERFNLPRTYINQLKAEGVPALEAVQKAMLSMGYDADLVSNMALTGAGRWSTFNDMLDGLKMKLSKPLFDVLGRGLAVVQGWFDRNKGTIDQWAATAGDALARFAQRAGAYLMANGPTFAAWAAKVAAVVAVVIQNVGMLAGYFASGLGAVLTVVTEVGQAIYDALSWINPFATHSPSLVSQVEDGVAVIMQAYSRLPGIGGPLGAAAGAVRAFAAAASDGLADYEAAQDQATAKTLAIFGADVPAAYITAKAAIGELQQSLVPLQAAITAQEGVVASWEQAVKSSQATLDAEKQKLSGLEKQLGTLQQAYDDAKKRVDAFASTPLAGTKALEDQIFAVEQQATGVQLALAQWKVSPTTLASIQSAQDAVAAQQGVVDDWSARVAASEQAVKGQEAAVAAAERAQLTYAAAVKAAQGAIEVQKERIAAANATLTAQKDALAAAQRQLGEYGKAQLAGTQTFADRIFGLDMAIAGVQKRLIDLKLDPRLNADIAATEGAIVAQTAAIADAERGMKGYDFAVDAAKSGLADQQAALADNRATVDMLTSSLKKAQDAIKGFAGTDIKGTKAFEDQLFALDQQAAAVKLQMNTLLLGGATKKDPALNALQDQLDAINLQAENVNLTKQLQLDPLRKQVSDLANATKELTFEEIVKGIKNAQGQEGDLTKKLADANGAYAAQQAVVDGAQQSLVAATAARDKEKAAIDASKDALAGLNSQLAALKATQAPKELTDQLANLQDRAAQVKLAERLELEPLRRQIAALLNPVKELSFSEITGGIESTRQTIAGLEQAVASSTTAWENEKAALVPLEAALKDAERARDDHAKVIDREKAALAGLKGTLDENRAGYAGAKDDLDKYNAALKAAGTAPKELTDALQALQDRADMLKLTERVQFDPLRRQIEDLAHPVKELTFAEITNGIRAAQSEMATIDPQIAGVTAQIAAQKTVVERATAAHDAATAKLAAERETLDGLKKRYADITGQVQDWEQALGKVASAASAATQAAKASAAAGSGEGGPLTLGAAPPLPEIDLSGQKNQMMQMGEQYAKTKKAIEDRVNLWKDRLTTAYGEVRDRITDVRDTVMGVLGPAFDWIDKNVTPVVERFAGFVRDNFPAIAKTIGIVAAGFAAFSILSTIGAWIASLVGFWGILSVAIEGVGGVVAALVIVLGGPLTLAIAAIVGVVTLLGVAWANNWGDIQGKVAAVWAWLQPVLADLGARLSQFWTDILPQLSAAWDSVSTKVVAAAQWLWGVLQVVFGAVAGFLVAHGDTILSVLGGAWALIQNTINTAIGIVSNVIRGVLALISGDWDGAWRYIQQAARVAWDGLVAFFGAAGGLLVQALGAIWGVIQRAASVAWDAISRTVGQKFSEIGTTIRDRLTQYKNDTGQQFSDMGEVVRDKLTAMKNNVGDIWNGIGTAVRDALTSLYNSVTGKVADLRSWLNDRWNDIKQTALDAWDSMVGRIIRAVVGLGITILDEIGKTGLLLAQIFARIAQNGIDKFVDLYNWVTGKVGDLAGWVGDKIGDLASTLGGWWQEIYNTVMRNWLYIQDFLRKKVVQVQEAIQGPIQDAKDTLESIWDTVYQTVMRNWLYIEAFLREKVQAVRDFVVERIGDARDTLSGIWDAVYQTVMRNWLYIQDFLQSKVQGIRDTMVNLIGDARDTLSGIWDTVSQKATGAWDAIKKSIWDNAGNMKDAMLWPFQEAAKVIEGIVKGFGNGIINALNQTGAKVQQFGDGIRNVINWIAEKLGAGGIQGNAPAVSLPGLASGTKNWGGGMAWVGEGPGGAGAELAYLPRGATVLTHAESMALVQQGVVAPPQSGPALVPGFAGGLGDLGGIFDVLKKGAGWLYDQAKGAVGLGDLSIPAALGDIGGKLAGKVKDWALGSIDKMLKAATPAPIVGGDVRGAEGYVFPVQGYGKGTVTPHHDNKVGYGGAADIFAAEGSPILAMRGGTVGWAGYEPQYGGHNVGITGDDGRKWYYAHMLDTPLVSSGQQVATGQKIGYLSDTGNAVGTGKHLHIGAGDAIIEGGGYTGGGGTNFDLLGLLNRILAAPRTTPTPEPIGGNTGGANWVPDAVKSIVGDRRGQLAMLEGAYMEGGWGPTFQVGDSGKAYGPYQIHAGLHGITTAQAEDAYFATKFMWDGGYGGGYAAMMGKVPDSMWRDAPWYAAARVAYLAERPEVMYPDGRITSAFNESRDYVGMANGGIIAEPIVGRGLRSGTSYRFGEAGPEGVFNADQMAALSRRGEGGGDTHINNYTIQSTEPTVTIDGLKREQRREERLRGYGR